jgi:hypothetical protein
MKTFSLIIILINLILSSLNETIPDSFDSREKWPNCISKINNQGNCGACYAFSVSEAFSMRYCIRNNLTKIINFSAQNLINCLSGCQGNFQMLLGIILKTMELLVMIDYLIKIGKIIVVQIVILEMFNSKNIVQEKRNF